MKPLRRAAGRYQTDKRKLTLPLRYFSEEERDNLLPAIVHFLEKLFGETDAEEGAPFAEMEGGASGFASDPASSVPRGIATDPAAGVSKNARTGSAKAVSQNAPTDSRQGGSRSALGQDTAKGSASATPAPTRPTGAANGAPTTSPRAMPPASVWPPSAPPVPPSAKKDDSRAAKCQGRQ